MNTDTSTLPPGLVALADRLSLDVAGWRTRARLDLRIDRGARVTLSRGRGQQVDLETRLARLPAVTRDREVLLDRLMLRATVGARARIATLVVSNDGHQLLLQASLADHSPHAVEEGLEAFLDDLDYWNAVMKERL
jgi:hypothetical protein